MLSWVSMCTVLRSLMPGITLHSAIEDGLLVAKMSSILLFLVGESTSW